jgi:hypothetical protein
MESLTPQESASAALPANRRDTLLLLRALRDGGDMRGAAWAVLGFESSDPRIRREAVDAMQALAKTLADARARFANDFDAATFRPFVAPWAARTKPLHEIPELRGFANGVLELAGEPVSDSPG